MKWENLPFHILEKIVFYAGDKEVANHKPHVWLTSIRNFTEVCTRWKEEIFSSKLLFPAERARLVWRYKHYCSFKYNEASDLAESGFLRLVKRIEVEDQDALESIRDNIEGNLLDEVVVWINQEWQVDDVNLLMEILVLCPVVKKIQIFIAIGDQEWAVKFWELLITTIECSQTPKHIYFSLAFGNYQRYDNITTFHPYQYGQDESDRYKEIDWDFVPSCKVNSSCSITELELSIETKENFPLSGPDWKYLTNQVKIDQLTIHGCGEVQKAFFSTLETKSLKIHQLGSPPHQLDWLGQFEKLYIYDFSFRLLKAVQYFNQKNLKLVDAHFILHRYEVIDAITGKLEELEKLLDVLPDSRIKSLSFSYEPYDVNEQWTNFPEITFDCHSALHEKWENYLDMLKVGKVDATK